MVSKKLLFACLLTMQSMAFAPEFKSLYPWVGGGIGLGFGIWNSSLALKHSLIKYYEEDQYRQLEMTAEGRPYYPSQEFTDVVENFHWKVATGVCVSFSVATTGLGFVAGNMLKNR